VVFATATWATAPAAGEQATIRLPLSRTPVAVDGTLKAGEWDDAVILGGAFKSYNGGPVPNSPIVYVKRDAGRLYIAYDNPLGAGDRPRMASAVRDTPGICGDNAVELYFMPHHPAGSLVWFIQFGGNARGAIFDTKRTPQIGISDVAGFSPPWEFKNSIVPGHWYSEVSQSFAALGIEKTGDGEFFDVGFERDGGCGFWGYENAFSGIVNHGSVKAIFDETAPVVQWLSFGEFEKHLFNPRLRLKSLGAAGAYTVAIHVTADKEDPNTKQFPELFAKTETLTLGAAESKEFGASFELQTKSAGIATYAIKNAKGEMVFCRKLPFKTDNAPRIYPKLESHPIVVCARMAPSFGRILATADIYGSAWRQVQSAGGRDGNKRQAGRAAGHRRDHELRLQLRQSHPPGFQRFPAGGYLHGDLQGGRQDHWRPAGLRGQGSGGTQGVRMGEQYHRRDGQSLSSLATARRGREKGHCLGAGLSIHRPGSPGLHHDAPAGAEPRP
jgi:hypothetical protein